MNSDDKSQPIQSNGWMGCAVQNRNGMYFCAMISDDDDGVTRFHVDRENQYATADQAIEKANYGRGLGYYRKFSHCYEIWSLDGQHEQ